MRPRLTAALGGLALVLGSLALTEAPTSVAASPTRVAAAAAPERTLAVSGAGVTTYPAFDEGIERYAVAGAEGEELRVRARTSDPRGQVLVDGVPRGASADVVVTGEPGEEVSVIFDDAGGRTAHSLVLLPDGFPVLEAETAPGAELDPGLVLLTLSRFSEGAPFFETAVDRNGVPVHVHEESQTSLDPKRQPNGALTVQRSSAAPNWLAGAPLVVLDERWQPTGETHSTVDRVNTDPHDSILLPNGHVILLSYEYRNTPDGQVQDSIAQEVDADGQVVFEWSTESLDVDQETVKPGDPDYAHVNSVVVMDDGHWLLSFRHFSAVFKVARFDDGEHAAGQVIWRLGGRHSDFAFPDDPHAGPCAQHTASELPNGNILIFDNGGARLGDAPTLCIDPAGPDQGRVDRPFTRITEYALDEEAMEARLVTEHKPDGRFAYFAGGVEQLPSGHRMVGWAASRHEIATELDADGQTALWTLRDTDPVANQRLFTYRAHLAEVPDAIAPTVRITEPGTVREGSTAVLDWQCRDRGGSGLADCSGPDGGRLDTSTPGEHTVSVTATDGAGQATTEQITYVVERAVRRVDAMVRAGDSGWKGRGVVGPARSQQAGLILDRPRKRVARVRIVNRGELPERFLVTGKGSTRVVGVVHRVGGRRITGKVTGAGFRTPVLAPGASLTVTMQLHRLRAVKRKQLLWLKVKATSDPAARDAVRVRVRVRP